jgi:hypothetical protein
LTPKDAAPPVNCAGFAVVVVALVLAVVVTMAELVVVGSLVDLAVVVALSLTDDVTTMMLLAVTSLELELELETTTATGELMLAGLVLEEMM